MQKIIITIAGILVIAAIGIGVYYLGQPQSLPNQKITVNSQPASSPVDETANWKTYQFTDKTGFGYEIKLPSEWNNISWGGGGFFPEPIELAQGFYGQRCSDDLPIRFDIQIFHFTDDPTSMIAELSSNKGAVSSSFKNKNNVKIQRIVHYSYDNKQVVSAFIISQKGYYQLIASEECSANVEKTFDLMLNTFKFTN